MRNLYISVLILIFCVFTPLDWAEGQELTISDSSRTDFLTSAKEDLEQRCKDLEELETKIQLLKVEESIAILYADVFLRQSIDATGEKKIKLVERRDVWQARLAAVEKKLEKPEEDLKTAKIVKEGAKNFLKFLEEQEAKKKPKDPVPGGRTNTDRGQNDLDQIKNTLQKVEITIDDVNRAVEKNVNEILQIMNEAILATVPGKTPPSKSEKKDLSLENLRGFFAGLHNYHSPNDVVAEFPSGGLDGLELLFEDATRHAPFDPSVSTPNAVAGGAGPFVAERSINVGGGAGAFFGPSIDIGSIAGSTTPFTDYKNNYVDPFFSVGVTPNIDFAGFVPVIEINGGGGSHTDNEGNSNQTGFRADIEGRQGLTPITAAFNQKLELDSYNINGLVGVEKEIFGNGNIPSKIFIGFVADYQSLNYRVSENVSGGGPFFPHVLDLDFNSLFTGLQLGLNAKKDLGSGYALIGGVFVALGSLYIDLKAKQTGSALLQGEVNDTKNLFAVQSGIQAGLSGPISKNTRWKIEVGGGIISDVPKPKYPTTGNTPLTIDTGIGYRAGITFEFGFGLN